MLACRAAANIAVHHYINNLDIVPRLLGATRLNDLLVHVVSVLPAGAPGNLAKSLLSVIRRAGTFVPYGQYHLIVGASLHSVDAAVDQAALLFTWKHAVEYLMQVANLQLNAMVCKAVLLRVLMYTSRMYVRNSVLRAC